MEDYYSLLGLDPDASPDTIKAAYRRLARENHPDLKISTAESERDAVSSLMARLNEAYSVLSNAHRRRDYDERMRIDTMLTTPGNTMTATKSASATTSSSVRTRIRPRYEVDPTVLNQFAGHIRKSVEEKRNGFSWKQLKVEGFDWGLSASSWSAHYCVALRGFPHVDPAVAKKFINYSEHLLASQKRPIRKNYFLFLLPFLQLSELESVTNQCQRFAGGDPPRGIVLIDMQHGRSLRFGATFKDSGFEQLLKSLRTSG